MAKPSTAFCLVMSKCNCYICRMNRFEPKFTGGGEAQLEYLDADYKIVKNGSFVRCAVTGKPIALDDLKYWSIERQEPYASAVEALKAELKVL